MTAPQANILDPSIGCRQCADLWARVRELTAQRDAALDRARVAERELDEMIREEMEDAPDEMECDNELRAP